MNAEYNEKTGELYLRLSVNPRSTQPSSTGKTFLCASERQKVQLGDEAVTIQINVTRAANVRRGKK